MRMNAMVVGVAEVHTVSWGVSDGTCIASSELRALPIAKTKYSIALVVLSISIGKSGRSYSSGVVSVPLVVSLESASPAW